MKPTEWEMSRSTAPTRYFRRSISVTRVHLSTAAYYPQSRIIEGSATWCDSIKDEWACHSMKYGLIRCLSSLQSAQQRSPSRPVCLRGQEAAAQVSTFVSWLFSLLWLLAHRPWQLSGRTTEDWRTQPIPILRAMRCGDVWIDPKSLKNNQNHQ